MRMIDADALKELFSEVIGHIAKKPEMNGNLEHMIRASAMVIQMIDDAPTVQPNTTTHDSIPAETGKNDGDGTSGDCISRQAAIDKFIDELEEIFSDIREREIDDSVCGLCEYDGAYIGQSGDWCNECPGFDRDDCFKLSDKIRKEWTDEIIKALPSIQPEQRWIPCSERQPDKEGDYLVTLLDDGRTWVEIALWNETFGGRWQAVLYNDVDYSDISNVIAWKPFSEPYQEGERNE